MPVKILILLCNISWALFRQIEIWKQKEQRDCKQNRLNQKTGPIPYKCGLLMSLNVLRIEIIMPT